MPGHVCVTLESSWPGILILASSIETVDSRSALKCSRQSFLYTLSFLQVPPSFLDFLFSFGSTSEPIDYHLTGFQGDKTVSLIQNRSLRIPRLGRSGLEHQMQYLYDRWSGRAVMMGPRLGTFDRWLYTILSTWRTGGPSGSI